MNEYLVISNKTLASKRKYIHPPPGRQAAPENIFPAWQERQLVPSREFCFVLAEGEEKHDY